MEYEYYKYPRTYHFSFSESLQNDDRMLHSLSALKDRRIIVTEKIDGENFSMYRNYSHCRSIGGNDHPSRHFVKSVHAGIKHLIPEGWRICGENMFALHSIYYTELPSYFIVFAIFNDYNEEIPWDKTVEMCNDLGLVHVPVLYDGQWDLDKIKACYTGVSAYKGWQPKKTIPDFKTFRELILEGILVERFSDPTQEGYVTRVADSFHYDNFANHTVKFVRKGHVTTSDHWMSEQMIKNRLKVR